MPELADERLRFADPDADLGAPLPVRAALRLPDKLPLKLRLEDAARYHGRKLRAAIVTDVAREEARGTPFFFVPVFMGLGSVIYFVAGIEPAFVALAAMSLFTLVLWRLRLAGGHKAWMCAALCLVAFGGLFAKVETIRAASTMLGGEISTQADLRIRRMEFAEKSVRITADVLATARPVLKYAPTRIRVTLRNAPVGLKAGDVISARFGLQPPSGPVRPGGYDFAFHAWFQGIGATGFSMGKIIKLPDRPAQWKDRMIFALENTRMGIAQRVKAVIPGTDGAMAAALIAGVAGGIDEDTNEALRLTGLAHIISISGLHMALVAGVFMVTIRLGFALFPAYASRLPVKKYGAAAALVASFCYLLLSGAGVATVRSFIMLAVMLIAVLFDRQALTLRNLAIAAVLILIVTPHEIMGPSFQMSFAATAALISAYSWMAERQQRRQATDQPPQNWQRAKRLFVGAMLTPVVAGLATALFSAWHFHRLAPMGLPANLAAMPVVSIIVMPFAVLSALAMPFGLEHWPLKIMGEGVHLMLDIARYFSALSPAGLSGAISRPAFLLAVFALLVVSLLQTRLRLAALLALPALTLMLAHAPMPDLLVSEDARLVASVDAGKLAVNRARPNSFTTQTWERATNAEALVKPDVEVANQGYRTLTKMAAAKPGIFQCEPGLCLLVARGGFTVAWLEQLPDLNARTGTGTGLDANARVAIPASLATAEPATAGSVPSAPRLHAGGLSATNGSPTKVPTASGRKHEFLPGYLRLVRLACNRVDLVITVSPTPFRNCPSGNARLLRASELARNGSAEIEFISQNNDVDAVADGVSGQAQADTMSRKQEQNAPPPVDDANKQQPTYPASLKKQSGDRNRSPEPTQLAYQAAASNSARSNPARAATTIKIRFAVGEPARPWNQERVYSRAARNMTEFVPVRRKAPGPSTDSPVKGTRRGPQ